MEIESILNYIDNGHMALPEFQRGYVWNRDQVRGLITSLYRRYPVGSLLVWATESETAQHRGDQSLAPGVVKLLLDGQQRITSLYGVIRGKPPKFFEGNEMAFTGLHFNMDSEEFSFYMPTKMEGNPLWVDVTRLMQEDITPFVTEITASPELVANLPIYVQRLTHLRGIREINLHTEEVTGTDKTLDVVVDIFNRVNSGGTKLSKGDLALAKVCTEVPEVRGHMRAALQDWNDNDYKLQLDWLLRNVTTIATGEARFTELSSISGEQFKVSLKDAVNIVGYLLDVLGSQLGLDHGRVLFGVYSFPVLARFVHENNGSISDIETLNKMLFWYAHCGMWGRYSGSTESVMGRDLDIMSGNPGGIDALIAELQVWRGSLRVSPDNFVGWSRGARFYALLYMLTRTGEALDWGLGIPLKKGLLGKNSSLEVHHIFPRNLLYKHDYDKTQVNAIANYCFLTKNTNLFISDRAPEEYFPEIAEKFPGALESQWIPMDRELWKVENYEAFLVERRNLLAKAANNFLDSLYVISDQPHKVDVVIIPSKQVPGGIESLDEEAVLLKVQNWLNTQGLQEGFSEHELIDQESGELLAILDLAWPDGLQQGLSNPVALLLNEDANVVKLASNNGYNCFEDVGEFKTYVSREILGDNYYGLPEWAREVTEKALPIIQHGVDLNWEKPVCGYEITDAIGKVKGEFELAWPYRKIGIWTTRGKESVQPELIPGWVTFSIDEVVETPSLLNVSMESM